MYAPLACSDYYEDSATTRCHQSTTDLPSARLAAGPGAASDRFPRSPLFGCRVSRPAVPRQHRHAYAADLQHGLRTSALHQPRSRNHLPYAVACTAPGPDLPDSSRWKCYEASGTGSSRTASRLACRARTVWQCRYVPSLSGLLTALPRVSAIRLPSASLTCCDRPAAGSFRPRPE